MRFPIPKTYLDKTYLEAPVVGTLLTAVFALRGTLIGVLRWDRHVDMTDGPVPHGGAPAKSVRKAGGGIAVVLVALIFSLLSAGSAASAQTVPSSQASQTQPSSAPEASFDPSQGATVPAAPHTIWLSLPEPIPEDVVAHIMGPDGTDWSQGLIQGVQRAAAPYRLGVLMRAGAPNAIYAVSVEVSGRRYTSTFTLAGSDAQNGGVDGAGMPEGALAGVPTPPVLGAQKNRLLSAPDSPKNNGASAGHDEQYWQLWVLGALAALVLIVFAAAEVRARRRTEKRGANVRKTGDGPAQGGELDSF